MMNEQYLVEIELPFRQDPQGDVIMEKSRDYCRLYFGCWDEQHHPDYATYIAELEFMNAWAVRSLDVEFYDLYPREAYQYHSSIFIVENSTWLQEVFATRNKYYGDNWTRWSNKVYQHYVVKGHDNYFEIIATEYRAEKIAKAK